MRVRNALKSATIKSLYESFGVQMLLTAGHMLIDSYDIYERTGCPVNIPLTGQHIARQLFDDAAGENLYLELIELLVSLEKDGYMGRTYPVKGLREIIKAILAEGFLYDAETGKFYENPQVSTTPNWGRLQEGRQYQVALLKIDIVGNSKHVRENQPALIQQVYEDLKAIVNTCTLKRQGRLWFWEGDGGVLAFHYDDPYACAILTAMEILQKWFLFNSLKNQLKTPLQVRMAVHAGGVFYSANEAVLKRNETIREVFDMESTATPPNAVTIIQNAARQLDKIILDDFSRLSGEDGRGMLYYTVAMEKA
ncbi:MAG: hypothetical protein A2087_09230 [Spirochaetes bacterium GWD1_61_31]|nr:MAG: hypothetical protein A2Y37_07540 [Spirochaetes bacterium GWB1_60_80]OHD36039.1 MAG: hypothetical protein A2087_09230 [Spirochaetes bacterium GWD1_61_31]OHD42122.1 MAG: hypothetical protein A2Y35_06515 [Spirochaetes bacterium GWE1_60_18]OHD59245.1 MAG: hypothetical protein A2Y32_00510 [Spirochaetes bacterium GWF1_60_12]HAP43912.1 hypothetical protein [Spirochaetaceae bacterium]